MVTRGQLLSQMAIGYRPVCQSKPGLWPCYPIRPQYGLMGMGMLPRNYPVIPRYGMRGLGQGLFGSTLFESINPGDWGWGEWTTIFIGGPIFLYLLYSGKHQARQHVTQAKVQARLKRSARAQKIRAKAAKAEERARKLEEKEGGTIGGLLFGR